MGHQAGVGRTGSSCSGEAWPPVVQFNLASRIFVCSSFLPASCYPFTLERSVSQPCSASAELLSSCGYTSAVAQLELRPVI